ncbi:MAG: hypothetical protein MJA30_30140 [Cytophagales bacterium]|nr:hypothetical protein [Cytophagales bacterium]
MKAIKKQANEKLPKKWTKWTVRINHTHLPLHSSEVLHAVTNRADVRHLWRELLQPWDDAALELLEFGC